jgi:lipopolysaccharide/colanic/teichoic acid biosynthesis glycosyltransferase
MYKLFFKRIFDIVLSSLSLLILSPLLMSVGILVFIVLGSPVFFRQKRAGRDEKLFTIYKFRTMNNVRDENGELFPDETRAKKLGRFLRNTSIDELPELVNILKGDMSFVGPRPLVEQYLPCYTQAEMRRHSVRPGLTGMAQISGRNHVTWEQRFECDLRYVENYNFIADIKIIFLTALKVLKRESIGVRGVDSLPDLDEVRRSGSPEEKD